jgi:hypothetical protein
MAAWDGFEPVECGLGQASCVALTTPEMGTWMSPSPSSRSRIALVNDSERVVFGWAMVSRSGRTAPAQQNLGAIDDGTRGMIEIDGTGYSVVPEPPVWIGDEALIVRVNERDLVRIDVDTTKRTTIVAGPRFLPRPTTTPAASASPTGSRPPDPPTPGETGAESLA